MFLELSNLADIDLAAEELKISVGMLKKLIKAHTGPKATIIDGKAYFDLDELREFKVRKTICKDGTVIPKVTSTVLGYQKRDDGEERPILACYCTGFDTSGLDNPGEWRVLVLIGPDGEYRSHLGYKEFGSGDGYRSDGYFLKEVDDPELAGFSDEKYLGRNALHPKYKVVMFS